MIDPSVPLLPAVLVDQAPLAMQNQYYVGKIAEKLNKPVEWLTDWEVQRYDNDGDGRITSYDDYDGDGKIEVQEKRAKDYYQDYLGYTPWAAQDVIYMHEGITEESAIDVVGGQEVVDSYIGQPGFHFTGGSGVFVYEGNIDANVVQSGAVSGNVDPGYAELISIFASGKQGNDSINGGVSYDFLVGGEGNDSMDAREGDDLIYGGTGDDIMRGGEGNDTMSGHSGHDWLRGGDGSDEMWGGSGNDEIQGASGNDTMEGGDGNDTLYGNSGDDVISGNKGDDVLNGGGGSDVIHGNRGNDTIVIGEGDTVSGGNGSDMFDFRNGLVSTTITDMSSGDRLDMTGLGLSFGDFDVYELSSRTVLSHSTGAVIELDGFADLTEGLFIF